QPLRICRGGRDHRRDPGVCGELCHPSGHASPRQVVELMARAGSSTAPTIPFRIILWLFGLITVIPFALLLLTSIKSKTDVLKGAFAVPAYPHFENYVAAWTDGRFGTYF